MLTGRLLRQQVFHNGKDVTHLQRAPDELTPEKIAELKAEERRRRQAVGGCCRPADPDDERGSVIVPTV